MFIFEFQLIFMTLYFPFSSNKPFHKFHHLLSFPFLPLHLFFHPLSVLSLCPWLSFLWGFDGCCDGTMIDRLSWFPNTNHDITAQSISFHITSHHITSHHIKAGWLEGEKDQKTFSSISYWRIMYIVSIIYSRNDLLRLWRISDYWNKERSKL